MVKVWSPAQGLPESRGDGGGGVSLPRYFASLAAVVDAERPVELPLPGRGVLRYVPSGPQGRLVSARRDRIVSAPDFANWRSISNGGRRCLQMACFYRKRG